MENSLSKNVQSAVSSVSCSVNASNIAQKGGGLPMDKMQLALGIALVLIVLFVAYKYSNNSGNSRGTVLDQMREKNVKILAATWCGYCRKLKSELDKIGNTDDLIVMHDKLSSSEKAKWKVNIEGYPMFIKDYRKTVAVGYMPVEHIKKKLAKV